MLRTSGRRLEDRRLQSPHCGSMPRLPGYPSRNSDSDPESRAFPSRSFLRARAAHHVSFSASFSSRLGSPLRSGTRRGAGPRGSCASRRGDGGFGFPPGFRLDARCAVRMEGRASRISYGQTGIVPSIGGCVARRRALRHAKGGRAEGRGLRAEGGGRQSPGWRGTNRTAIVPKLEW